MLLARVDPKIRDEVQALLAHDTGDGPFGRPALQAAAEILGSFDTAPMAAGPAFEPSQVGQYRILEKIGEGGMGSVYRAEQHHPKREVALKVIRPGWSTPQLLRRFEDESRALGRLQHIGIAQIYEAGTADAGFGPQPYFAMELIQGPGLLEYAEEHRLGTNERLELTAKICDAVEHAHQRWIIHRDLKPGNILVDQTGQPKILDFGVARITDSDSQMTRQTDVGQIVGTLAYMSPEQVLADPLELDTRSDVYSLGVILYELLSGRLPYTVSRKLHEAMQTIRETDPAPLSSVSRNHRGDIETIVAKAMEKDKARRYPSAASLAADIRRYLSNEPIAARPASKAYLVRKFALRNRALVAGATAVLAVLVGGILVSTWQAVRANRSERAALAERDRTLAAEAKATAERDRAAKAEAQAIRERNVAIAEKSRADNEAATANAVNQFLERDLLAQASASTQANPDTKPDPDLKVRTALDRAAARISGKFDQQPLVEAALRQTIGRTYQDLSLYREAQPHLERALNLHRRIHGEEHPDTLSAMFDLGELYASQGKFGPAQTAHARVLEIRRRVLSENHPATARSMSRLAGVYESLGKYAEAERLQTKALEVSRRVAGEEDISTISVMLELGLVQMRLAKYQQAEELDTKVVEVMRRVLSEDHPLTLIGMNNLAQLYFREGKYGKAEEMQSRVLEIRRRVLGEDHSDTAVSRSNLAVISVLQGKSERAEALLVENLEILRKVLGAEHPNTLTNMNNLARVYSDEGKYAQAEALNTKVLEVRRRNLGEEHPDTLRSMTNLAGVYRKEAKYAEADPLYRKARETLRRLLGAQHPDTVDVTTSLSQLRLAEHKYQEAEPLAREALDILEKTSAGNWKSFFTRCMLGASRAGQKRFSEAEPLLVSGYNGLIERKASIPIPNQSSVRDSAAWIVELYSDWGKAGEAAEWRAKLENDKTASNGAERR